MRRLSFPLDNLPTLAFENSSGPFSSLVTEQGGSNRPAVALVEQMLASIEARRKAAFPEVCMLRINRMITLRKFPSTSKTSK